MVRLSDGRTFVYGPCTYPDSIARLRARIVNAFQGTLPQAERSYPELGVRLEPPPPGAAPGVSPAAALETVNAIWEPSEDAVGPDIELADYIDSRSAERRLAWVVTYHQDACIDVGPRRAPTPGPSSQRLTMFAVDAGTGGVIGGPFQQS